MAICDRGGLPVAVHVASASPYEPHLVPATLDARDDIVWIRAEDYYSRIHLRDRSLLVRESLRSLADELSGAGFVRVHRSAIVRLSAIRAIEPLGSGDQRLTLTNGTRLRVSRTYRTALVKALSGGG